MKALVKNILSHAMRLARPAVRPWAQSGYFAPADPAALDADRIAILACHWIGDTYWAMQVMPALRRRFPDREFTVLAKPHCLDLWAGHIRPQRRIALPEVISDRRRERTSWKAIAAAAQRLREMNFDLVIDLTGNRYSAAFAFLLRPKCSVGFGGDELGWLHSHNIRDAQRPGRHLSERPFRVIAPLLGGEFAYSRPLLGPQTDHDPRQVLREMGLWRLPYYVLAPGAGWAAKQWPAGKFHALAMALAQTGVAVVVAGSAAEAPLCAAVADGVWGATVITGEPLGKIVPLIQAARGVAGNDSGIVHLAAGSGVPTAAIFTGATDPAICGPLGPEGLVQVMPEDVAPEAVRDFLLTPRPAGNGGA